MDMQNHAVLSLTRNVSIKRFNIRWLILFIDLAAVVTAVLVSYEVRFIWKIPENNHAWMYFWMFVSSFFYTIYAVVFRLYHRIWRYANERDLIAIVATCLFTSLSVKAISFFFSKGELPTSIWLSAGLCTLCSVTFSRLCWKFYHADVRTTDNSLEKIPTIILGAGYTGATIVRSLRHQESNKREFIGFIDDEKTKTGLKLMGLTVLGTRADITNIVRERSIEQVIVAVPSIPRSILRDLVDELNALGIQVFIANPIHSCIRQSGEDLEIRPIEVEDLLGRVAIPIEGSEIGDYLRGKTVLVTGAGGSIGSEISRQVAAFQPQKLILLGRGENSIFSISQELRREFPNLYICEIIANIVNELKISLVFEEHTPDVVFHAAAHKHVPLMEQHPDEAYINNVRGTQCLLTCAHEYNVQKFILISSDKAVYPTNVMGASKRITEMLLQSRVAKGSATQFMIVRFGNVLGSRGSVVQIFRRQIAQGGPVTVTDARMERYFMTIPEAVRLVVEAGCVGKAGHMYLLNMGKPVRIMELAERMIRLSGFEPGVDIPIQIVGTRPGEKLKEELTFDGDLIETIGDGQMFRVKSPVIGLQTLDMHLSKLKDLYVAGEWGILGIALRELALWHPEKDAKAEKQDNREVLISHVIDK